MEFKDLFTNVEGEFNPSTSILKGNFLIKVKQPNGTTQETDETNEKI